MYDVGEMLQCLGERQIILICNILFDTNKITNLNHLIFLFTPLDNARYRIVLDVLKGKKLWTKFFSNTEDLVPFAHYFLNKVHPEILVAVKDELNKLINDEIINPGTNVWQNYYYRGFVHAQSAQYVDAIVDFNRAIELGATD